MSGPARAEQVRDTRQRVLLAARDLFLRRGYAGAAVGAIAHRAGVSPQTVYNVVGSKAAVLKAVYDVTLAGDDDPVPMIDRPTARAMLAADDARECLRLYARMGRELAERAGPLLTVVFVQAAGRDPEVRAFVETIEGERAAGTAGVARHIAGRFGLRDGLGVAEAGDILWALTAPELLDRFVRRRGWTLDRWEAWLSHTMAESLLTPGHPPAPSAGRAPTARCAPG
jgi:AcrR family transcriptional regulator